MRFAIPLPSRGGKASAMRSGGRFRSESIRMRGKSRATVRIPSRLMKHAAKPERRGHSCASLAMIARLMLEYKQLKYNACYYR